MRTLLVTGASGFLGAEVCRRAQGAFTVHGTYLTTTPAAPGDHHRVDLRSFPALGELLVRIRPDAIVHTAYRQDDPEPWELNRAASVRLAGAAAGLGARLVHVSTDLVFGGGEEEHRPLREDDPVAPVDAYGRSKAEAERLVLERAPQATVVRTSLILGGDGSSKHEQLVLSGGATFFDDEHRSPVHVGDLAAALLELLDRDDAAGVLHVAGPDVVTRLELARLVAARHGLDPDAVRGGPGPPERAKWCALDVSRAQSLLRTRIRGARDFLAPAAL